MKELSKKGEKFYNRWETLRKRKWFYVFLHGTVCWGLPIALILFLLNSQFQVENMKLSKLLTYAIVFGIGGIFNGLREFKQIDKIYLSLNDDDEIVKGIQIIKNGNIWNYDNLKLHNGNDEALIIQNELFWFDERVPSSDKLNDCFISVYGDFQRLQKNKDFGEYSKNRKVKIQIFDNSESNVPLLEKVI